MDCRGVSRSLPSQVSAFSKRTLGIPSRGLPNVASYGLLWRGSDGESRSAGRIRVARSRQCLLRLWHKTIVSHARRPDPIGNVIHEGLLYRGSARK